MLRAFVRTIRNLDAGAVGATVVLVALALAALGSIAPPGIFWKQVIALGIGAVLFLFFAALDYRALNYYRLTIVIVGLAALVAVIFFGATIRGTTGWFRFGPVSFQPVEFVKIALIIYLAGSLARHAFDRSLRTLLSASIIGPIYAGLVLVQPDFGSVVVILALWLLMLVLSGMSRRHILLVFAVFIFAAVLSWSFVFKDYQRARIITFLNPATDSLGRGYNLIQSVITVGSGGFTGRGLGQGTQSQLRFLPEGQTDFIFAVIGEEFGFMGVAAVLGLFAFLLYRGIRIGLRARDDYTTLLAFGIVLLLGIEIIVNVGMNMGLLPVTGIALPLMSAGGSSLVSTLILLGILESIAVRQKIEAYRA